MLILVGASRCFAVSSSFSAMLNTECIFVTLEWFDVTQWRSASQVVAVVAAAGFIAGLLGIGGALIFNPFLLQLGVHPQVSWLLPSSALLLPCIHGEKSGMDSGVCQSKVPLTLLTESYRNMM